MEDFENDEIFLKLEALEDLLTDKLEALKEELEKVYEEKARIITNSRVKEFCKKAENILIFKGDINNFTCEEDEIFIELYMPSNENFKTLLGHLDRLNNLDIPDDVEKIYSYKRCFLKIKTTYYVEYTNEIDKIIDKLILAEIEKRRLKPIIDNF